MILSIITINYNDKEGLKKTIPSVLNQSGISPENLEYIIIDGASTDGSLEIIKEFYLSNSYPHKIKKWISEKDTGIYNAINKGIKIASGDLIALVNSGDMAVFGAYDNVLSLHKQFPDSILYGAINLYKNGKFIKVDGSSASDLECKMISHPAALVPKKIYNKYGFYDENYRLAGDWDLFLTFFQKGVDFHYINKIIVDFDLSGISNVNTYLIWKENRKLLKSHGIKRNKTKIEKVKYLINLLLPGFCYSLIKLIVGNFKIINKKLKIRNR